MCQMLFLRAVMWYVPPSFQFWGCASALRAGGALVMANPTSCWEVCGCRDGWTDRQLHKASPVPCEGGTGDTAPSNPSACSVFLGRLFVSR